MKGWPRLQYCELQTGIMTDKCNCFLRNGCVRVCVYECGVVYFKSTFIQQTSIDLENITSYNPSRSSELLFISKHTSFRTMTGRGKGGKGLGKGGAKRHRKVLRDNIQVSIQFMQTWWMG